MQTAMELLEEAPIEQVTRMQIAYKAILAGRWEDAAFTLHNAALESDGGFAADCLALAEHCRSQAAGAVASL